MSRLDFSIGRPYLVVGRRLVQPDERPVPAGGQDGVVGDARRDLGGAAQVGQVHLQRRGRAAADHHRGVRCRGRRRQQGQTWEEEETAGAAGLENGHGGKLIDWLP